MDEELVEDLKSKLKNEFSNYYEVAGGKNYRYYHLETSHKIAKKLTQELEVEVDQKVVEIAALFHDIGRVEDIENGQMNPFDGHEGHDKRGADLVSDYISEHVTSKQLKKIQNIILNHHSNPETVEGKIIQDADNISNFGVNNLWRQFHYASDNDRNLNESLKYFWETAVKDYKAQIKMMNFDYSRKVAKKRLDRQKEAFKNIEEEMNAEDL